MSDKTSVERKRGDRGWTQEQLSELTGISQSRISEIEARKRRVFRGTIMLFAQAFGDPESDFEDIRDTRAAERGKRGGEASRISPKENRENSLVALAVLQP